jgi:HEAT repeat protein
MIGRNITKWLDDFATGPTDIQKVAAFKLMKISEHYFEDHKVSIEERKSVVNEISNITSTDPIVQECIASLTGMLQILTIEVENILDSLLSNKSESVLINAVWATGNLKSNAKTLIPKLLKLQNYNSREVRFRVAYALKEIAQSNEAVRITLLKLTKDPDWLVRMHALDALSVCILAPDVEVENVLVISLDDKDQAVQAGACRAIGMLNITSKAAKNKLILMAAEMSDALWALSKNWPELFYEQRFRKLLEANSGYPWANKLLANIEPVVEVKKSWLSKLFSN